MKQKSPSWLAKAIIYEVYPQSFLDTNGDGIGDLPGVIAKLDYIHSLGCDAIWLNPCFEPPFVDAGYDISDFCKVAERYGSNRDLKRLFREAHKRGMRVVLDLVAGHSSDQHPWFIESAKDAPKKFRDRYVWTRDWLEGGAPGMGMVHGGGERNGNYAVNFFSCQPALNYGFAQPDPERPWQLPVTHPEVKETRAELRRIMKFWLDAGADGFRVDMAPSLVKNDPDKSANIALWREVRTWMDQDYPEAVLISEWGHAPQALSAGFHIDFLLFCGTRAYTTLFRAEPKRDIFSHVEPANFYPHDSVPQRSDHSFFTHAGKGDIAQFLETYQDHLKRTKNLGHMAIPSGNHDMPRLNHGRSKMELAVAFAFLLTMPGVPFIYYGDEIGMRHIEGLPSKEGGYTRTGARTPMQWSSSKNAGFSTAKSKDLYLPIDPAKDRPTVEAQENEPDSLLQLIRRLAALRREHPALGGDGDFKPLYAERNKYPFIYRRKLGAETIIVAVNPSKKPVKAKIKPGKVGVHSIPLEAHGSTLEKSKSDWKITMTGISFGIFKFHS
jgi:glycosidase